MKTKLFFITFILFSSTLAISQSIKSFSPSTGNAGEKINVTITGQNTNFQQGTDVVHLTNGSTVLSPQQSTFVNDTLIESVFAFNKDQPTGYYSFSIIKNGSSTLSLANCFYLNTDPTPASISSVTPLSAKQGDTITLKIKGLNTNFSSAGISTTIWLKQGSQQINGSNVVVVDSVTIQARFIFTYAYPAGNYDVYFYNLLDGTVTDAGGFLLNSGTSTPSIVSCQPNTGTQGELLTVSITGQNTNFQQGTDVIKLTNGSTSLSPQQSTFVNDSLIHSSFAFTTNNPTGYYNLSIQKSGSYTLSLNNCFFLNPATTTPSIVSVAPSSATQTTTVTLTITGLNTHFGHSGTTTTVSLKQGTFQINPTSTIISDSLTIQSQFTLSTAYPTGLYDVSITNTIDGTLLLTGGFTINTGPNSPTITSVSPNTALPGETLSVSITGQNTLFEQGTDNVNLSRGSTVIYPTNLSFVSTTLINATFYFSTSLPTGYYNVNVTGNDAIILTNGFQLAHNCYTSFSIVPDSATPHHYYVISNASGTPPLKYYWSWGDGTYDSIAYPTHTYSAAGNYTICLTIADSVGCTSNYCDSSYLQKNPNSIISVQVIQGITGINEYELFNQIKVYPIPATDKITIEGPPQAVIEIINIQGQLIKTVISNGNKETVDVSAFPSGIYFVKARTAKRMVMMKLIKQ